MTDIQASVLDILTLWNLKINEIMTTEKKRRGRPVTAYKVPLMVRVSQEAADKIAQAQNKSEVIDRLILKHL